MASKSGTSKTPTGGRKTPQSFSHVRPPSPKVDLSASKSKSAPSPKPKSEYLRSKGKSPSNHHERSFNNGHNNNDDCEYSVRSVFDESQLAKIKVVVEKTRLNVIDAGVDDRNHFHAVPNNHKYDPDNDMSLTYGEFAGECIEPTPRALVTTSTDDCAVSDITADAPYMAQPVKYNNVFANNALIEADDLASLPMDVLDNMAKMIQEEKLKRSRVQGTPVVSHTATPVTEVPLAKNDIHNIPVPEAVNARKHVGRARSGGNEQMIRKNRNSPSVQNSHFPSFRSYRQGIEELGDVPLGSMDLADVTPSKSVDGVDGEVERALRGLMLTSSNSQQAIQSVTPTSHIPIGIASSAAHHSVSHPSTAGAATAAGAAATSSSAMPTLSPAGVSSHPLSRGTSTSVTGRGSGTYVGIDRMYHDSSTFTSPLHYVESPTHAAGNVIVNHGHSSSASRPVAPPRVNNLMDPLEPTTTAGPSSAQKHTKKFDSFREAKQYSDSQIDVAVVEEFQPVGVVQKEKQQHVETAATLTTPPVRPIMTRTVSAGSDLSLEAQQLDSKTVAAIVEFNTLLQRDAAESSSSAVNRRNRDLLVSPLCAFDDCASMGSLKSGGSRRSTASHTKKSGAHSGGKDKSHHPHKTSHVNYTSSTSSYLAKQINNRL